MEGEVISRRDLGGSLPVENVQALASKHLKDIPHRYIRPEVEFDEVSVDDSWQIPAIDMSKLGGTGQLGHDDESAKLHCACKDWGFFQVHREFVLKHIQHNFQFKSNASIYHVLVHVKSNAYVKTQISFPGKH